MANSLQTTDPAVERRQMIRAWLASLAPVPPPRPAFNMVAFVDRFLNLIDGETEVRCEATSSTELHVTLSREESFTLSFELARSRLRVLLARLAVLCSEMTGGEANVFGGDVEFTLPSGRRWHNRWFNTTGRQEFTLNQV